MKSIILTIYIAFFLSFSSSFAEKIELNLNEGDVFKYDTKIIMNMEMLNGMKTDVEIITIYENIIDKVDGDSISMTQKIVDMDMVMAVANDDFSFSASSYEPVDTSFNIKELEKSKDIGKMLNLIYYYLFDGIKGSSYQMVFNPKGEVYDVLGFQEFLENAMTKGIKRFAEAIGEDVGDDFMDGFEKGFSETMQNQFTKEMLAKGMEYYFMHLPGKDVQAGDSWNKVIQFQDFGTVKADMKLEEIDSDIAKIDLVADQNIDLSKNPAFRGLEMVMDVKINGNIDVDMESGMPQEMNMYSLGSGSMSIEGEEMTMRISSKMEFRRID